MPLALLAGSMKIIWSKQTYNKTLSYYMTALAFEVSIKTMQYYATLGYARQKYDINLSKYHAL